MYATHTHHYLYAAAIALTLAILLICAQPAHGVTAVSAARAELDALIASPRNPLPPCATVRTVQISHGLATVSFSHELLDNFAGGDTRDIETVTAILRSLGAVPGIDRARILIEGRAVETLGGLIAIDEPLDVIRPVLRPGLARRSPPAAPYAKV